MELSEGRLAPTLKDAQEVVWQHSMVLNLGSNDVDGALLVDRVAAFVKREVQVWNELHQLDPATFTMTRQSLTHTADSTVIDNDGRSLS